MRLLCLYDDNYCEIFALPIYAPLVNFDFTFREIEGRSLRYDNDNEKWKLLLLSKCHYNVL